MNAIKNNETCNDSNSLQIIEDKGKVIMLLVGLLMLITSTFIRMISDEQPNKVIEVLLDVVGQVGGIFVSTAGIAYFYDKYRDKKQLSQIEERKKQTANYIKLLSRGIQEKVYVECIDKEFIDIIPRQELDKNKNYRFEVMTKQMAEQSAEAKEKHPVLIYGSTLGFLDWISNKNKRENDVNKKALIEAVQNGVHFKLALNSIDSINTNNADENRKKQKTIKNVVNGLQSIIAEELSNASGSIDLRYLPIVEKNSFSSFACNGRRISVLDFNFDNNKKFSQIFDEKITNKNEANNLALMLLKSYNQAHEIGIPCISYNRHKMDIYIIGISQKRILVNVQQNPSYFSLPHIRITEKGGIDNDTKDKKSCCPINIYKEIIDRYKEITDLDIQLREFLSPEDKEETKCFIVGYIDSDKNMKDDCQWKDVYDKKGVCTLFTPLKIKDSYLCKLQNLLEYYGIDIIKM